jgi:hypothetical protein
MIRVTFVFLSTVFLGVAIPVLHWSQTPQPSGGGQPPATEVLISTLPESDIAKRLSGGETIDHTTEVMRGKPVTAILRAPRCQRDPAGACRISAELVVYQPDGSPYRKADIEVGGGSGTAPLTFDAQASAGVYRVVATVRDLVSRTFVTVERRFAVK